MTNLALCGLGKIGSVHLENLRSLRGCRVVGLFDTRRNVRDHLAAHHGIRAYASLSEMLSAADVQAIVVATPTDSHRAITVAALEAGKHVFVEKPLAGTIEDAQLIVDAARRSGLTVQVGFCERFNAQYLEARRAVASRRLGSIRSIHSSRVAPYSSSDPAWELGVLDTAVHNLDLILWLMGRPPVTVSAHGVQVYPDSAIPHSLVTLLRFEDGALAADHIAWIKDTPHPLSQCARSRLTVIGDRGVFEVDLTDRPASLFDAASYRMCDTVILGGPDYYGCLKLQFEGFLRSIEEGVPVLAPAADALQVERVVIAARDSIRSGKETRLAECP